MAVVFHAGCLIGNIRVAAYCIVTGMQVARTALEIICQMQVASQVAAYCTVTGMQVARTALLPKMQVSSYSIAGAYFTDCCAGYIITYTMIVLAKCRLHHALVVLATCRPQLMRAIRA